MGIGRAEALDSLQSDDLLGIGMEADAVRRRIHPEGVVTYAVTGSIHCADRGSARASAEDLFQLGASGVLLHGLADLGFDAALHTIAEVRRALSDAGHSDAWISGLTPSELANLARASGCSLPDAIAGLVDAGWNAPATRAPDLADPTEVETWLAVHRAAHRSGLRTTAETRFRAGESPEPQLDFLLRIAALQDETGGFSTFAPVIAGAGLEAPTAVECLKLIAVSRLLLDTIPSIEAGRATGSLKVLETMLRFGADDAGAIVLQPSAPPDLREEDLRRVIRDAGFSPIQRDAGFRLMFVA